MTTERDLRVPTMVTIKEAMARTGLSRFYLKNACDKGEIVHIKSGRIYFINYEKLIAHLNGENTEMGGMQEIEGAV